MGRPRRPRALWWRLFLDGRLPGQTWIPPIDPLPAGVGATAGRPRTTTEEVPGG